MKHKLQEGDAVLITPESIKLIKKAEKELELPVHSQTYEYMHGDYGVFCFRVAPFGVFPTMNLAKLNTKDINILSFEEFKAKLYGNTFTVYIPEGKIPVVTYKAENGITIDFKPNINYDKITTGSTLMIECTGKRCWGEFDKNKPVDVVFWKTPHFIADDGKVKTKGYHPLYTTFIQEGKIILFSAAEEINYVKKVIKY
jgi:hypothetical protein